MQGDPICHAIPSRDDPDILECLRCLLIWRKDDGSRPACPLAVAEQIVRGRTFAEAQNHPIESSYTIDCALTGDAITAITLIASEEGIEPRKIIARAVNLYIAQRRKVDGGYRPPGGGYQPSGPGGRATPPTTGSGVKPPPAKPSNKRPLTE